MKKYKSKTFRKLCVTSWLWQVDFLEYLLNVMSWHKGYTGHLSEESFVQNVAVQIPKLDAKPLPNANRNLALTLTQILTAATIYLINYT